MSANRQTEIIRSTGIDPAALAAAAVAGALTVFAPPGPYALGSIIVGLTLLAIILGYDFHVERKLPQKLAFSAVFGLCCVLLLGWPMEVAFAANKTERFMTLFGEKRDEQNFSEVPPIVVLLIWISFSGARLCYETWRARPKSTGELTDSADV